MLAATVAGGLIVTAMAGIDAFDNDESRQQAVAERGARVMPFDLEATTHVFDPTDTGGVQTVTADDPTDTGQVGLVRDHLREEQDRFRAGDFGDPVTIHGDDMPGMAVLEQNFAVLETTYRDRPDGGQITYRSSNPIVVAALHDWFEAQLEDHGSHAEGG